MAIGTHGLSAYLLDLGLFFLLVDLWGDLDGFLRFLGFIAVAGCEGEDSKQTKKCEGFFYETLLFDFFLPFFCLPIHGPMLSSS